MARFKQLMLEIGFILLLIIANGFFAAAEMAFVTSRASRLRALAEQGDKRAERVLASKEESGNFLAMVQIGTTLVATLASAVGGASTARLLAPAIEPLFGTYAENVALGVIVIAITYVTLVIGELVPKQLALQNAESFAMRVMGPLNWLQTLFWLPIKILDLSISAVVRLFGSSEEALEIESTEEIALIVQQAASDGIIDGDEEDIITRVFDFAEANLADIMTPRPNIVYVNKSQTADDVRHLSVESGFSRFIVIDDELDNFIGYIHVKDLLTAETDRLINDFVREVNILPETLRLPSAFDRLVRQDSHLALVLDEFGSVSGLVTLEDMLEEIVGEIEDEYSGSQAPSEEQQEDKSWLIDGATSLLDVKNIIGIELPETSDFNTLAGFFLHQFGAIPKAGDSLLYEEIKLTIESMEGHRISLVRILPPLSISSINSA